MSGSTRGRLVASKATSDPSATSLHTSPRGDQTTPRPSVSETAKAPPAARVKRPAPIAPVEVQNNASVTISNQHRGPKGDGTTNSGGVTKPKAAQATRAAVAKVDPTFTPSLPLFLSSPHRVHSNDASPRTTTTTNAASHTTTPDNGTASAENDAVRGRSPFIEAVPEPSPSSPTTKKSKGFTLQELQRTAKTDSVTSPATSSGVMGSRLSEPLPELRLSQQQHQPSLQQPQQQRLFKSSSVTHTTPPTVDDVVNRWSPNSNVTGEAPGGDQSSSGASSGVHTNSIPTSRPPQKPQPQPQRHARSLMNTPTASTKVAGFVEGSGEGPHRLFSSQQQQRQPPEERRRPSAAGQRRQSLPPQLVPSVHGNQRGSRRSFHSAGTVSSMKETDNKKATGNCTNVDRQPWEKTRGAANMQRAQSVQRTRSVHRLSPARDRASPQRDRSPPRNSAPLLLRGQGSGNVSSTAMFTVTSGGVRGRRVGPVAKSATAISSSDSMVPTAASAGVKKGWTEPSFSPPPPAAAGSVGSESPSVTMLTAKPQPFVAVRSEAEAGAHSVSAPPPASASPASVSSPSPSLPRPVAPAAQEQAVPPLSSSPSSPPAEAVLDTHVSRAPQPTPLPSSTGQAARFKGTPRVPAPPPPPQLSSSSPRPPPQVSRPPFSPPIATAAAAAETPCAESHRESSTTTSATASTETLNASPPAPVGDRVNAEQRASPLLVGTSGSEDASSATRFSVRHFGLPSPPSEQQQPYNVHRSRDEGLWQPPPPSLPPSETQLSELMRSIDAFLMQPPTSTSRDRQTAHDARSTVAAAAAAGSGGGGGAGPHQVPVPAARASAQPAARASAQPAAKAAAMRVSPDLSQSSPLQMSPILLLHTLHQQQQQQQQQLRTAPSSKVPSPLATTTATPLHTSPDSPGAQQMPVSPVPISVTRQQVRAIASAMAAAAAAAGGGGGGGAGGGGAVITSNACSPPPSAVNRAAAMAFTVPVASTPHSPSRAPYVHGVPPGPFSSAANGVGLTSVESAAALSCADSVAPFPGTTSWFAGTPTSSMLGTLVAGGAGDVSRLSILESASMLYMPGLQLPQLHRNESTLTSSPQHYLGTEYISVDSVLEHPPSTVVARRVRGEHNGLVEPLLSVLTPVGTSTVQPSSSELVPNSPPAAQAIQLRGGREGEEDGDSRLVDHTVMMALQGGANRPAPNLTTLLTASATMVTLDERRLAVQAAPALVPLHAPSPLAMQRGDLSLLRRHADAPNATTATEHETPRSAATANGPVTAGAKSPTSSPPPPLSIGPAPVRAEHAEPRRNERTEEKKAGPASDAPRTLPVKVETSPVRRQSSARRLFAGDEGEGGGDAGGRKDEGLKTGTARDDASPEPAKRTPVQSGGGDGDSPSSVHRSSRMMSRKEQRPPSIRTSMASLTAKSPTNSVASPVIVTSAAAAVAAAPATTPCTTTMMSGALKESEEEEDKVGAKKEKRGKLRSFLQALRPPPPFTAVSKEKQRKKGKDAEPADPHQPPNTFRSPSSDSAPEGEGRGSEKEAVDNEKDVGDAACPSRNGSHKTDSDNESRGAGDHDEDGSCRRLQHGERKKSRKKEAKSRRVRSNAPGATEEHKKQSGSARSSSTLYSSPSKGSSSHGTDGEAKERSPRPARRNPSHASYARGHRPRVARRLGGGHSRGSSSSGGESPHSSRRPRHTPRGRRFSTASSASPSAASTNTTTTTTATSRTGSTNSSNHTSHSASRGGEAVDDDDFFSFRTPLSPCPSATAPRFDVVVAGQGEKGGKQKQYLRNRVARNSGPSVSKSSSLSNVSISGSTSATATITLSAVPWAVSGGGSGVGGGGGLQRSSATGRATGGGADALAHYDSTSATVYADTSNTGNGADPNSATSLTNTMPTVVHKPRLSPQNVPNKAQKPTESVEKACEGVVGTSGNAVPTSETATIAAPQSATPSTSPQSNANSNSVDEARRPPPRPSLPTAVPSSSKQPTPALALNEVRTTTTQPVAKSLTPKVPGHPRSAHASPRIPASGTGSRELPSAAFVAHDNDDDNARGDVVLTSDSGRASAAQPITAAVQKEDTLATVMAPPSSTAARDLRHTGSPLSPRQVTEQGAVPHTSTAPPQRRPLPPPQAQARTRATVTAAMTPSAHPSVAKASANVEADLESGAVPLLELIDLGSARREGRALDSAAVATQGSSRSNTEREAEAHGKPMDHHTINCTRHDVTDRTAATTTTTTTSLPKSSAPSTTTTPPRSQSARCQSEGPTHHSGDCAPCGDDVDTPLSRPPAHRQSDFSPPAASVSAAGGVTEANGSRGSARTARAVFSPPAMATIAASQSFTELHANATVGGVDVRYAFTSLRGSRNHQEDNVLVLPELSVQMDDVEEDNGHGVVTANETRAARDTKRTPPVLHFGCFGVFDGHNGDAVSLRASQYYLEHFQLAVQQHYRHQLQQQRAQQLLPPSPDHRDEQASVNATPKALPTTTHEGGGEKSGNVVSAPPTAVSSSVPPQQRQLAHRTFSAALVQSLLHLDVTLYDTLQGPQCEAGSTACIAACYLPTPAEIAAARMALSQQVTPLATADNGGRDANGTVQHQQQQHRVVADEGNGEARLSGGCVATNSAGDHTEVPPLLSLPKSRSESHAAQASLALHMESAASSAATCAVAGHDDGTAVLASTTNATTLLPVPSSTSSLVHGVEGVDYLRISIANLGDSRAVLGHLRTGALLLETSDHRARGHPREAARITRCGGRLEFDRVEGSLDVTRGLGDYRLKQPPALWWNQQAELDSADDDEEEVCGNATVSAAPSTTLPVQSGNGGGEAKEARSMLPLTAATTTAVSRPSVTGNVISNIADVYEWEVHDEDFLVLASDGVWDRMSSEEVVHFVTRDLQSHRQQKDENDSRSGGGALPHSSTRTADRDGVANGPSGVAAATGGDALHVPSSSPLLNHRQGEDGASGGDRLQRTAKTTTSDAAMTQRASSEPCGETDSAPGDKLTRRKSQQSDRDDAGEDEGDHADGDDDDDDNDDNPAASRGSSCLACSLEAEVEASSAGTPIPMATFTPLKEAGLDASGKKGKRQSRGTSARRDVEGGNPSARAHAPLSLTTTSTPPPAPSTVVGGAGSLPAAHTHSSATPNGVRRHSTGPSPPATAVNSGDEHTPCAQLSGGQERYDTPPVATGTRSTAAHPVAAAVAVAGASFGHATTSTIIASEGYATPARSAQPLPLNNKAEPPTVLTKADHASCLSDCVNTPPSREPHRSQGRVQQRGVELLMPCMAFNTSSSVSAASAVTLAPQPTVTSLAAAAVPIAGSVDSSTPAKTAATAEGEAHGNRTAVLDSATSSAQTAKPPRTLIPTLSTPPIPRRAHAAEPKDEDDEEVDVPQCAVSRSKTREGETSQTGFNGSQLSVKGGVERPHASTAALFAGSPHSDRSLSSSSAPYHHALQQTCNRLADHVLHTLCSGDNKRCAHHHRQTCSATPSSSPPLSTTATPKKGLAITSMLLSSQTNTLDPTATPISAPPPLLVTFILSFISGFFIAWYAAQMRGWLPSWLSLSGGAAGGGGALSSTLHNISNLIATGEEVKMTLVVRKDLKMGTGKIAAQCAHAAVAVVEEMLALRAAAERASHTETTSKATAAAVPSQQQEQHSSPFLTAASEAARARDVTSSRRRAAVHPWIQWYEAWRVCGSSKVVLQCPDEPTLMEIARAAKAAQLPYYVIRDAGRTQIAAGSKTVLAVGPGPKSLVDQVTGQLKLL